MQRVNKKQGVVTLISILTISFIFMFYAAMGHILIEKAEIDKRNVRNSDYLVELIVDFLKWQSLFYESAVGRFFYEYDSSNGIFDRVYNQEMRNVLSQEYKDIAKTLWWTNDDGVVSQVKPENRGSNEVLDDFVDGTNLATKANVFDITKMQTIFENSKFARSQLRLMKEWAETFGMRIYFKVPYGASQRKYLSSYVYDPNILGAGRYDENVTVEENIIQPDVKFNKDGFMTNCDVVVVIEFLDNTYNKGRFFSSSNWMGFLESIEARYRKTGIVVKWRRNRIILTFNFKMKIFRSENYGEPDIYR